MSAAGTPDFLMAAISWSENICQRDTFLHCPAPQLSQKHPELAACGFAFALYFKGYNGGLVVAAQDLSYLHIMEL